MNRHALTPALAALLVASAMVNAADQAKEPAATPPAITLKVGDLAPRLQTGQWIQGQPVKDFDRDHVYLVEFWATWCGPCQAAIPHLNELHNTFKDRGLVVIGQNVWETAEPSVPAFVKKMGDQMTYRVALDDKSGGGKGSMSDTWMAAAGQDGIPTGFLVDQQGRIAWIGQPMGLDEKYLEKVLANTHDIKPVAAAARKTAARREQVASKAQEINPYIKKFTSQLNSGQWAEAEETVNTIEELSADLPEGERVRLGFQRLRLLVAKGDFDVAATYAETKLKVNSGNDSLQGNVARLLAEAPGIKGAGLALASKLAEAGYAKGGQTAMWFTTTLARVKFIQGDKGKAIELQTEALKAAEDAKPVFKNQLQSDLDSYKAGKLPVKG